MATRNDNRLQQLADFFVAVKHCLKRTDAIAKICECEK